MKRRIADLHIHSVHSDGTYTVEEIFNTAEKYGFIGLSITDHDTIDGIFVAYELMMSNNYSFAFVPGCEFTTYMKDEEIHILGYFLNPYDEELKNYLKTFRKSRLKRMKKMLKCLQKYGINITLEDMGYSDETPIGRMHLARAMVRKGYFKSVEEAFKAFLDSGKPCYFKREKVETTKVIKLIRSVGGLPVAAHPLWLKKESGMKTLKTLVKSGLLGIEYKHPYINDAFSNRIKEIAQRYNLVLTAGSDFHGEMSERNKMGTHFLTEEEFVSFLKASEFSILSWK